MDKPEKVNKISFKDYYQSLTEDKKKELREKVIAGCGISYPTFYSKLQRGNYSFLEQKEIMNICQMEFTW